jgi:uncharacterized protein (DUF983 family)
MLLNRETDGRGPGISVSNREPTSRDVGLAMLRGLLCRCPRCGKGHLFRAYLVTHEYCPVCGEALYHHRADDAPPYFVILTVGHIVIASVLAMEVVWHPRSWVQFAIWIPVTMILTLALLPPIKGVIIGFQWARRMHGFGSAPTSDGC